MKLLSMFLALTFCLNVFAGPVSDLERHLNDYNYALTVEWDQRDKDFYDAKSEEFYQAMTKLIEDQGLTQEEVLKFAESRMDKASVDALRMKFSVLSKNSTAEDLAKVIQDSSNNFYNRGASWGGRVLTSSYGTGLVIVGLIGFAIWYSLRNECENYEDQYTCDNYSYCNDKSGFDFGFEKGRGHGGGGYGGGSECGNNEYCTTKKVCTKYRKS